MSLMDGAKEERELGAGGDYSRTTTTTKPRKHRRYHKSCEYTGPQGGVATSVNHSGTGEQGGVATSINLNDTVLQRGVATSVSHGYTGLQESGTTPVNHSYTSLQGGVATAGSHGYTGAIGGGTIPVNHSYTSLQRGVATAVNHYSDTSAIGGVAASVNHRDTGLQRGVATPVNYSDIGLLGGVSTPVNHSSQRTNASCDVQSKPFPCDETSQSGLGDVPVSYYSHLSRKMLYEDSSFRGGAKSACHYGNRASNTVEDEATSVSHWKKQASDDSKGGTTSVNHWNCKEIGALEGVVISVSDSIDVNHLCDMSCDNASLEGVVISVNHAGRVQATIQTDNECLDMFDAHCLDLLRCESSTPNRKVCFNTSQGQDENGDDKCKERNETIPGDTSVGQEGGMCTNELYVQVEQILPVGECSSPSSAWDNEIFERQGVEVLTEICNEQEKSTTCNISPDSIDMKAANELITRHVMHTLPLKKRALHVHTPNEKVPQSFATMYPSSTVNDEVLTQSRGCRDCPRQSVDLRASLLALGSEECSLLQSSERRLLLHNSEGNNSMSQSSEGKFVSPSSKEHYMLQSSEGYSVAQSSEGCSLLQGSEENSVFLGSEGSSVYNNSDLVLNATLPECSPFSHCSSPYECTPQPDSNNNNNNDHPQADKNKQSAPSFLSSSCLCTGQVGTDKEIGIVNKEVICYDMGEDREYGLGFEAEYGDVAVVTSDENFVNFDSMKIDPVGSEPINIENKMINPLGGNPMTYDPTAGASINIENRESNPLDDISRIYDPTSDASIHLKNPVFNPLGGNPMTYDCTPGASINIENRAINPLGDYSMTYDTIPGASIHLEKSVFNPLGGSSVIYDSIACDSMDVDYTVIKLINPLESSNNDHAVIDKITDNCTVINPGGVNPMTYDRGVIVPPVTKDGTTGFESRLSGQRLKDVCAVHDIQRRHLDHLHKHENDRLKLMVHQEVLRERSRANKCTSAHNDASAPKCTSAPKCSSLPRDPLISVSGRHKLMTSAPSSNPRGNNYCTSGAPQITSNHACTASPCARAHHADTGVTEMCCRDGCGTCSGQQFSVNVEMIRDKFQLITTNQLRRQSLEALCLDVVQRDEWNQTLDQLKLSPDRYDAPPNCCHAPPNCYDAPSDVPMTSSQHGAPTYSLCPHEDIVSGSMTVTSSGSIATTSSQHDTLPSCSSSSPYAADPAQR